MYFDATLEQKCYFWKSRRPSQSYLGPKVRVERSKVGNDGAKLFSRASRRGFYGQVWLVGLVLLGNHTQTVRKRSESKQAELKVYLRDKSYD